MKLTPANITIKVNNKDLKVNRKKRLLINKLIGFGFVVTYNIKNPNNYKLLHSPDPAIH